MADLIIVDDDAAVRDMVADMLAMAGHSIRSAQDGAALDVLLAEAVPDLVVLDLGLSGENGLSIARRLRETHELGILMLTGADDLVDRVVGLEVGADDYVTKPFSPTELAARVEAILRRRGYSRADVVPFGVFTLDLRGWKLHAPDGSDVGLFPTEIDLVAAFATNPGRMLSRDDLLQLAPAHGADPLDRSIDSRMTRLRRKLEATGHAADMIETSQRHGYIYKGATTG